MAEDKKDQKKAGDTQARDVKPSDEAVKDQDKVPTKPEARGETDPDAAGEKVGAVKDGDSGAVDEDVKDEDYGWLGTVAERDAAGDEVDVPWVYLTADHLPRTSDSDDPNKGWTAQDASGEREETVALVEVHGTPGQTFRTRELPNRKVAEKAGVDYNLFVSGLPVRPDVDSEAPRRGTPA